MCLPSCLPSHAQRRAGAGSEPPAGRQLVPRHRAGAADDPLHGWLGLNREGDTWILNGQKRWIGNPTWCDVSIIWARDLADNQVKGFIVENKTTPGFSVEKIEHKIALKVVQNGQITRAGERRQGRERSRWSALRSRLTVNDGQVDSESHHRSDPTAHVAVRRQMI
jgi:hypothetical protein